MPRTLDATLEAAMASGSFQPYFLLTVAEAANPSSIIETAQPVSFKLSGIKMNVKWVKLDGSIYGGFSRLEDLVFKLTRGVTIAGVNYTTESSFYYGTRQTWDGNFQIVEASMLPHLRYLAAADVTYETLLDALCTEYGKTAVYRDPAAAWLGYQFLESGKQIILDYATEILPMLRQKYVIFACDNGNDEILFSSLAGETQALEDHTINIARFKEFSVDLGNRKRFTWTDETGLVSASGDVADSLWNLGYLESTASAPSIKFSIPAVLEPIAPNLEYLSMDFFKFNFAPNYPQALFIARLRMVVEEEFNYKYREIAWRLNLKSYDWAAGGENAVMQDAMVPERVEKIFSPIVREDRAEPTNYAPVNPSRFGDILTSNETTLQAALDKLDRHTHGVEAPVAAPTATNDFLVGAQVSTVWRWVKKTLAETITILRTSLDGIYAPIAKGVTNGDSHNHVGGDGAALTFIDNLITFLNGATVPASSTRYTVPSFDALLTGNSLDWPATGTFKNLFVKTSSAQPGTGAMTVTLQINGVDSALTLTIAAGAGAGAFTDTTHSVAIGAGNSVRIELTNAATGASAQVLAVTMAFEGNTG